MATALSSSVLKDKDLSKRRTWNTTRRHVFKGGRSGQIVGILKAMMEDMEALLKEVIADEEKAVVGYGDWKSAAVTRCVGSA